MMGMLLNMIGQEDLQPGEHIYSWRSAGVYAHHGIYIGDENVIHFTSTAGPDTDSRADLRSFFFSSAPSSHTSTRCQNCADAQNQYQTERVGRAQAGAVIISCLDCFLNGGYLYRFTYSVSKDFFMAQTRGGTCTMAPSDHPNLVIYRAIYLLNHGFGPYSLFKRNCEDFAIYCKTSLLVNKASRSISGQLINAISFSFFLVGLDSTRSTSSLLRYQSDIGVRTDVTRVPVERLVERRVQLLPTQEKGPDSLTHYLSSLYATVKQYLLLLSFFCLCDVVVQLLNCHASKLWKCLKNMLS